MSWEMSHCATILGIEETYTHTKQSEMEEVRPGRKMVESGTEKLFYKTGTKELQAFAKEKLSCEKNIGF